MGDVQGNNRLGGIFLRESVVFGRVAGVACAKYMFGDNWHCWRNSQLANGSYEDTIVSNFLSHHCGGQSATLTVAGKDAISEFDMIHLPDVIEKYAPDAVIGVIGTGGDSVDPSRRRFCCRACCCVCQWRAKDYASDRMVEYGKGSPCTSWPFIYMVNHLTKKSDVWVVVHGRVLDVSNFLSGRHLVSRWEGRLPTRQNGKIQKSWHPRHWSSQSHGTGLHEGNHVHLVWADEHRVDEWSGQSLKICGSLVRLCQYPPSR